MARSVSGFTVDGPELELHADSIMGQVGTCYYGAYGSNRIIRNTRLNAKSRGIRHREQFDGHAVKCEGQNSGSFTFTGNEFVSAPGGGLLLGQNTPSNDSFNVSNNTGVIQAKYTNGFMFQFRSWTSNQECFFQNNTFDCSSEPDAGARFVHFASTDCPVTQSGNNVVTRDILQNQEYEGAVLGGVYSIQLEGRSKQIEVSGDSHTIIGDGGGYPIRLSGRADDLGNFGVSITDTRAVVDIDSVNPSRTAACFNIAAVLGATVTLDDLELATNSSLLNIQNDNDDAIIVSNSSLRYFPGYNQKPFIRDWRGHGTVTFRNMDFFDEDTKAWVQSGWKNVLNGAPDNTAVVIFDEVCIPTFTDGSNPLVGVEISIRNSSDEIVFSGTTDANGQVTAILQWFRTVAVNTTIPTTSINNNPFEISSNRNASTFEWVVGQTTRAQTFNLDL
jgi:hypothetical protein